MNTFNILKGWRMRKAQNNVINEVQQDYFEKYSQLGMSKDKLRERGNEAVAELIKKELLYVRNELNK